jgi:predicted lipoprotein with Yx(FWY)xxD motif
MTCLFSTTAEVIVKARSAASLLALTALVGAIAGAASGCASAGTGNAASPAGKHVTVKTAKIAGLGAVLVTADGDTLYMFPPDKHRRVTCTGACAGTWPPLRLSAGATPAAGVGVKAQLLGSLPDPGGGRVVTYHGWPLYTYVGDIEPGEANGQALNLNGAPWYVLRPDGSPLIPTGRTPNKTGQ